NKSSTVTSESSKSPKSLKLENQVMLYTIFYTNIYLYFFNLQFCLTCIFSNFRSVNRAEKITESKHQDGILTVELSGDDEKLKNFNLSKTFRKASDKKTLILGLFYSFEQMLLCIHCLSLALVLAGHKGWPGHPGPTGLKGDRGDPGPTYVGPPGDEGAQGDPGAPGDPGPQGELGLSGKEGQKGISETPSYACVHNLQSCMFIYSPGPQGESVIGSKGRPGSSGYPGMPGEQGDPGIGLQGKLGSTGLPGNPGKLGLMGDPGNPGIDGSPGRRGQNGAQGARGVCVCYVTINKCWFILILQVHSLQHSQDSAFSLTTSYAAPCPGNGHLQTRLL
uniref:Uncharacterized protein n=1 Tax=Denticeps clupeoides TaxID=299321 RepID=A0AAY4C6L9_9TELE